MNTTPSASPGEMNGGGVSNGHLNGNVGGGVMTSTKAKIFELTSYSSKLETVLLALLKDQQDLLDKFESFKTIYDRDKGMRYNCLLLINFKVKEVKTLTLLGHFLPSSQFYGKRT